MKKEKWLYLLGGIAALVALTILLVGLINGVWPWSEGSYFGNYKGNLKQDETQQTTQSTTQSTQGSDQTTEASSAPQDTDIKIPIAPEESTGNTEATNTTETEATEETGRTPSNEQEIAFEDLPKQTED